MNYLIDTNVISEIVRPKADSRVLKWFDRVPNESLFLSVLTMGEIRKGVEKISQTSRKQKLLLWLEHDLPGWFCDRILPISFEVADKWGVLQAEAKQPLSAIDSLLAATALHHDLTMVTRNVDDFKYPLLRVINPWLD